MTNDWPQAPSPEGEDSMSLDQTAQWRKTNLAYDDAEWDYPKYTHAVIARGHALVVEFCERLAGEQDGSPTILDIGCGPAPFYDRLRHVIGTYIGLEPSADPLQRAGSGDAKYLVRGSGERLVVADGCVDIALLIASLDHCLDAEETVRETFRVLRPGGTALFLLENRGRISNGVRAALGMDVGHGDEHLYFFDVDDLLSLAEPYGEVSFLQSYGFLLGFNWIGSVVPFRVLSMLSSAADTVVGTLFPKRVQHFIVTVRKHGGDSEAKPLVFLCGTCRTPIEWQGSSCSSCGSSLRWIDGRILDALMEEMAGETPREEHS